MIETQDSRLSVSDSALQYLKGKDRFFASRARFARIVLNGVSCSGANFSLFHDFAANDDLRITVNDITILVEPELMERFGGFDLDTERFFFATRVLIKPRIDDRNCDCKQKCHNDKEER